jgi:hypothetical protein
MYYNTKRYEKQQGDKKNHRNVNIKAIKANARKLLLCSLG